MNFLKKHLSQKIQSKSLFATLTYKRKFPSRLNLQHIPKSQTFLQRASYRPKGSLYESPLLSTRCKPTEPIILADKKVQKAKRKFVIPALQLEHVDSPDQVTKLEIGKTQSSSNHLSARHSARNFPSREDLLRKAFQYPDALSSRPSTKLATLDFGRLSAVSTRAGSSAQSTCVGSSLRQSESDSQHNDANEPCPKNISFKMEKYRSMNGPKFINTQPKPNFHPQITPESNNFEHEQEDDD